MTAIQAGIHRQEMVGLTIVHTNKTRNNPNNNFIFMVIRSTKKERKTSLKPQLKYRTYDRRGSKTEHGISHFQQLILYN